MKEAISQETANDVSHSRILEGNECTSASNGLKSAAMLGLALSVGASGALVAQTEATAAVPAPTTSATTEAFSSDSQVSATTSEASAVSQQVAAYHTVEAGESLWQIAQQHRVGLRELKGANALPPETAIRVGQVLKVPGSETHVADASSELVARITADDSTAPEVASRRSADKLSRLQGTAQSTAAQLKAQLRPRLRTLC